MEIRSGKQTTGALWLLLTLDMAVGGEGALMLRQTMHKARVPSFPVPPEGRPEACRTHVYDVSKMPSVSVIIPYLHENYTLIEHTVGSLIAHTPPELLDEILFVDDANDMSHKYTKELRALHPKVRVHRNAERQGLIKAKVTGASLTKSPVLVFFEPHCIANKNWLEPLLRQLKAEPQSVAVPVIDIIPEEDTNSYRYAPVMYGGFDWKLTFRWINTVRSRNSSWQEADAFPMPALSGGIFAINRDWWDRSGAYDTQMVEWGGENIEQSLRMWRCGGSIRGLPCSRVGHMFRKARPYKFHGAAALKNNQRVAAVWLDNYLESARKADPAQFSQLSSAGPIGDRLALRERLGCKDMNWYVANVYPELQRTAWADKIYSERQ